jgi:O-antigen/teichoic acid export membrane protein
VRFSAETTAERLLPERLASCTRPFLGRLDSILFSRDERLQAGRVSLLAFGIRIVSAVIAFASQVLLARWIGAFEYGIFVLVWTAITILGSIVCLGFNASIIRFIPEYREKRQAEELRGVIIASRRFVFAAATLIAATGLCGVWLFSDRIESYYVWPFYLGFFCLPMIALAEVVEGVARANSWVLAALSPTYIVRPVLIMVFTGVALLAGYEASAAIVLIAAILATYVTAAAQFIAVGARSRDDMAGPRKFRLLHWVAVSLPIFLVESFFSLLMHADVLLVGRFMEPDSVAVYFATVKTLALVHFVYFAVKAGSAQRFAQLAHSAKQQELAEFARATANWTFWPSLAFSLLVLAFGKLLLALFGPGFDEGYPLLFVLLAGVVARAAVGPAESLLTMSGNQNVCAGVYALTLMLNVSLAMLLIPPLGLWGAACATAAAMMFEAVALAFVVWRRQGIVMAIFAPAKRLFA